MGDCAILDGAVDIARAEVAERDGALVLDESLPRDRGFP
jgi:hypothetical protein